jgi:hypothetical protein
LPRPQGLPDVHGVPVRKTLRYMLFRVGAA